MKPQTAAGEDGPQPWLGLLPYTEADQALFFGREDDTAGLLRLVKREALTVLFGRSGTGKSSLLKAGLFPLLREEQFLPVWIRLDHSGKSAYGRQIRDEIAHAVAAQGIETEVLNDALAGSDNDVWEHLHRVMYWDSRNQPITPVLVFDQFEEWFTLGRNRPGTGALFEELAAVVESLIPRRVRDAVVEGDARLPQAYNERHYKVILSLREDYVAWLDRLAQDMPSVMHNRFALTPMTGGQALDVVLKPSGGLVSEAVALRIVRFVAAAHEAEIPCGKEPTPAPDTDLESLRVEPALLSLVCSELNLQRLREHRDSITMEQVQRSSDQILEDFYERSLRGLDPSDRRFIEDRLVTGSGFRTAVSVEEAVDRGLDADEIETLVARRLLRKEDRLGIPHIELTHDVLTRVVTRSRGLRQQREEAEAARLEEAALKEERRRKKEQEELEKQRARRIRNTMRAFAVVVGLTTVLAVISVVLLLSRRAVEKARQAANARALALNAIDVLQQDPELALLLSIESAYAAFPDEKIAEDAPTEIEMALHTAIRESLVRRRYEGHTGEVYSVDFDRDGRRLLTSAASPDGAARLWDANSSQPIAILDPAGNETVSSARFSPDGSRVVTSSYRRDGAVMIWNVESLHQSADPPPRLNAPVVTFTGHQSRTTTAAFSPDGKIVASGGYDRLVRLWDPETGMEIAAPLGSGADHHRQRIRSVAFNAEGTELLSTSDDGSAILWDLKRGSALRTFAASSTETLHDGDLSPSGTLVALAGNDRQVRVWDAATGVQLASKSHPDGVMGVSFIDDARLVTVCNDSTIRFWELGTAADPETGSYDPAAGNVKLLRLAGSQRGHRGWIRDVAVSPDGRFIATAGRDTTARLWKIPPGGETTVAGKPEFVCWAADLHATPASEGHPERLILYAGAGDGTVRVVDAFTEQPLENRDPLEDETLRHTSEIRAISTSPDGARLVTSSSDQTAIVWNAITGRPLFRLEGHRHPTDREVGGTVYQARYSADGARIATAGNDGSAWIWNAATGAPEVAIVQDQGAFGPGHFPDKEAFVARLRAAADPVAGFLAGCFTEDERARVMDPATPANESAALTVIVTMLNRVMRGNPLKDEPAFSSVNLRPVTSFFRDQATPTVKPAVLNRLMLEDAIRNVTNARFYDARFSHDGSRLVTADFDARTATLWDARDGKPLRVFPSAELSADARHRDSVVSAAFSPDDKQVVTACTDGFGRVWDAETGKLVAILPHGIAVRSAEFSPDGKQILTSAADGIARLWKVTSPGSSLKVQEYATRMELRGHTDTLIEARFSNGGAYLVTSSRDGTARVHHIHPWWLYSLATQRVTRKLTREEWGKFNIERPLTAEEEGYYSRHGPRPDAPRK